MERIFDYYYVCPECFESYKLDFEEHLKQDLIHEADLNLSKAYPGAVIMGRKEYVEKEAENLFEKMKPELEVLRSRDEAARTHKAWKVWTFHRLNNQEDITFYCFHKETGFIKCDICHYETIWYYEQK